MRINVKLKRTVHPELVAHLESIPEYDRAERIRVLATLALCGVQDRGYAVSSRPVSTKVENTEFKRTVPGNGEAKQTDATAQNSNEEVDKDSLLGIGNLLP